MNSLKMANLKHEISLRKSSISRGISLSPSRVPLSREEMILEDLAGEERSLSYCNDASRGAATVTSSDSLKRKPP